MILDICIGFYVLVVAGVLVLNRKLALRNQEEPKPVDPMFDFDILEEESKWR